MRAGAPRPFGWRRPGLPLAAQQLHTQGDTVVPGYGQDAHEASQEGHLKHVLLVGIVVQVAREDLEGAGGRGGGQEGQPPPQSLRPDSEGPPTPEG